LERRFEWPSCIKKRCIWPTKNGIRLDGADIAETSLTDESAEVAAYVAGYVCKQIKTKLNCDDCSKQLLATDAPKEKLVYLDLLSCGGLLTPSNNTIQHVCSSFAILDFVEGTILQKFSHLPLKATAQYVLNNYGPNVSFSCKAHIDHVSKLASRIFVNLYFNNKQKLANDAVRKEQLLNFKKRQRVKRH